MFIKKTTKTGDVRILEKCPLRCGFVGQNMSKHITEQHPLHPVKYCCSACDFTHGRKSEVTMHVSKEHEFGKATVKAHVMSPCVYRWDPKKKYLRTYPPGTLPYDRQSKPYPEGWLRQNEGYSDDSSSDDDLDVLRSVENPTAPEIDPARCIIGAWLGENDQDIAKRSQRRAEILKGRQMADLSEKELRSVLRTMSYTRSDDGHMGWGPKGKLTRHKTRNSKQRVGQRRRCRMNCGWNDHKIYTKHTCPLHPKYAGDKPKVRGDHEDAVAWKAAKAARDALKTRIEEQLRGQQTIPCGYGCGELFRLKSQRKMHMQNCTFGGARTRHGCTTPGCKFQHANGPVLRRHVKTCVKSYAYTSPVCPACGTYFVNRKVNSETGRLELCDTRAKAYWAKHEKLYHRSRQVDCQSCGAPHLVPWCTYTPKAMGRQFRCSDNYFDINMGSSRCRRIRPGVIPWWASQSSQKSGGDNDNGEQVDLVGTTAETEPTMDTTGESQKLSSQTETVTNSGPVSTDTDGTDEEWDPIRVESDEYVSEDGTTPTTTTITSLLPDEADGGADYKSARF